MTSYARMVLLVCSLLMSGCAEYAYWHGRTFYGIDCSPAVVQAHNGKCAYLKTGTAHAEKTRP
jgi:hypothetical protein